MKYNPYFRDPIPLITIPRAYKNLYIRPAAPTSIEETPNEVVEEPVVSDVEEIRHTPPKGRIIFKNDLDPGNLQPLLQKFWENGINVRVTSGKQNRKTSSGKTSWHTSGDAIDITPIAGETYSDLKNKLSQKPALLQWMRDNGYGILDETTPSMMARTGSTWTHWHIGKDRLALDNFKAWFGRKGGYIPKYQRGKLFPNTNKDTINEIINNPSIGEDTYIDGYGVQRSLREGRQEGRRVRSSRAVRNIGEALSVGTLGAAVAVAPAIPAILTNPWVGAGLTSYFGAHGIQRAPETIQQTREAFQEGSTRDKVEAVSNAILNVAEVAPLVRPIKVATQVVTPIVNKAERIAQSAYYNNAPWTWKPNPNAAYRAIPEEAIDDAIESGIIRTKPQGQTPMQKAIAEGREPTLHERLASGGSRAKGNVYFSRGIPLSSTYSNRYTTGQGSNFGTHLIEAPIERLHRIGPKGRQILDAPVGRDIPMGASATPTTPLQTSEVTLLKPSRIFGYRKVPYNQSSQIKTPFTVTEEMQPSIQEVLDDTYKVVTPMKDNPLGSRLRTGALERTGLEIDPKSLFQPSNETQRSFREVMRQQLSDVEVRKLYNRVNSQLASKLENGTATIADFADEVKVLTPSEPYTTSVAGYYNPLDIPIVDNIHTARKSLQFKNNPSINPEGNIGKMLQQYERNHEIQHVFQDKSNLKEFYKGTDGLSEFIDPTVLKGNWLTNGELGSRIGQLKDYYNITDGSALFDANTVKNMMDLYIKSGNGLDNGISNIGSGITDWKKFAEFANKFALSSTPPSILWKGIRTYNNPNDKFEDYIKYKQGGKIRKHQSGDIIYNPYIRKNEETNFNGGISLPLGPSQNIIEEPFGYQKGQYDFQKKSNDNYITNGVEPLEVQEDRYYNDVIYQQIGNFEAKGEMNNAKTHYIYYDDPGNKTREEKDKIYLIGKGVREELVKQYFPQLYKKSKSEGLTESEIDLVNKIAFDDQIIQVTNRLKNRNVRYDELPRWVKSALIHLKYKGGLGDNTLNLIQKYKNDWDNPEFRNEWVTTEMSFIDDKGGDTKRYGFIRGIIDGTAEWDQYIDKNSDEFTNRWRNYRKPN